MTSNYYGEAPVDLGPLALPEWQEFMHYLYLPVRLPADEGGGVPDVVLPARLEFLRDAVEWAFWDARQTAPHLGADPYVYVTARRGFATPGNPLNRPGWHCDDFGGSDLNYIWTDRFPTRFLTSDKPLAIPADDAASMHEFEVLAGIAQRNSDDYRQRRIYNGNAERPSLWIEDGWPTGHLLRLSPYVIHDTPLIPEPGGMRSFFKISVSTHRYNLLGNSHNHLLDYDWKMYDRAEVRNRPQGGNSDYVTEDVDA